MKSASPTLPRLTTLPRMHLAALLLLGAATLHTAHAQTTWSTAPATGTMATDGNWAGGTAPADNTAWVFTNSSIYTLTNNWSNRTVAGITFLTNAGAYTIGGSNFTLTGGITNSSTNTQTISNTITINSAVTFSNTTVTSQLKLVGAMNGSGTITYFGLNNSGNRLDLSASSVNWSQFNGSLVLQAGRVQLGTGVSSTNADYTVNTAQGVFLGAGTYTLGSLSGTNASAYFDAAGSANVGILSVGYNNKSTVFAGYIRTNNNTGGSFGLTKVGMGTLALSGANTYVGTTTVSNGVLQIGTNGTTGSITGSTNITLNGGWLAFNRSDNISQGVNFLTNGAALTGTGGGLIKMGAGTLSLNAANTYSGTTRVDAGKLVLSNALAIQNSAFDTAGAGTLSLASGITTPTLGGLIGNGAFAPENYGSVTALTLNTASDANLTYSGVISNGAAGVTLTKSGTGTQILSGNNTYSGGTTLNSGTLGVGNSSALGSGTLTIGGSSTLLATANGLNIANNAAINSGTLTVNVQGNTMTNSGAISGAGALTKSGVGKLVLSGSNSYTGATTVNAGNLAVNGSLASTNTTVNNSGTLSGSGSIAGTTTIASGGTISPGNSPGTLTVADLVWEGGGNYNWQVYDATGAAGTGYDTIAGNSLNITATTGNKFNINLWSLSGINPDVNGAALNFTDIGGNYSWKLGSFTTGISGFDTSVFSVNTAATNGTGGFANPFTGQFSLTTNSTDLILTYVGPAGAYDVTVGANAAETQGVASGGTNQFTGSSALNKLGAGTLIMTNSANDYTGVTTIKEGSVQINVNAPNGSPGAFGSAISAVLVGDSSTNLGAGFNIGAAGVTNSRDLTVVAGTGAADRVIGTTITSGTAEQAGGITLGTNATLNAASGGTMLYSGNLSGSGNLTISNEGTSIFSASNAYTGTTTILNGATLRIANNNALGSTNSGTTVNSGGTLALSNGITSAEGLAISGTGVSGAGAVRSISGNNTLSGGITLGAASRINSDADLLTISGAINAANNSLTVGGNGNTTVSGAITNSTAGLTKDGTGTLTLSGANTYSGDTTVNSGVLRLSIATAIQNSALNLSSGGGVLFDGITAATFAGLKGNGNLALTNLANSAVTLTLSNGASTSSTYSGALSGVGGLTKTGAGTQILSGNNSYSGNTTISGGTLSIASSGAYSTNSLTTVAAGATLNITNSGVAINTALLGTFLAVTNGTVNIANATWSNNVVGAGNAASNNSVRVTGGTLNIGPNGALALTGGRGWVEVGSNGVISIASGGTLTTSLFQSAVGSAGSGGTNLLTNSGTLVTTGIYVGNSATGLNQLINSGSWSNSGNNINIGQNAASSGTNMVINSGDIVNSSAINFGNAATTGLNMLSNSSSGFITNTANIVMGNNTANVGSNFFVNTGYLTNGGSANFYIGNAGSAYNAFSNNGGTAIFSAPIVVGSGSSNNTNEVVLTSGSISGAVVMGRQGINQTNIVTVNGGTMTNSSAALNIGNGYSGTTSASNNFNRYIVNNGSVIAGTITMGAATNNVGLNKNTIELNGGTLTANSINAGSLSGEKFDENSVIFDGGTLQAGSSAGSGFLTNTLVAVTLKAGGGTINSSNRSITIGAGIQGVGGLTVAGSGTLTLSGGNTYTGGTILNSGGLTLSSSGHLGATNSAVTVNGGILNLGNNDRTNSAFTIAGGTFTNGTLVAATYALRGGTIAGSLGNGAITVGSGDTFLTTGGRFNSAASLSITNGTLNLGGNETVSSFVMSGGNLAGSGRQLTASDNNYTLNGGIVDANLGSGTLNVGGSVGLNGTSAANTVTINNGADLMFGGANRLSTNASVTLNGELNLATYNQTLTGLTGSGMVTNSAGSTLRVNKSSGSETFSGALRGAGGFIKGGAGTFTLTGNNNTIATTAVDAGLLVVNGTLSSATTINSGGTLGGTGSITSVTVGNGGALSPGNSPGLLTVSDTLTLNPGGSIKFELSNFDPDARGTGWDAIDAGTLSFSSLAPSNKFTIDITSFGTLTGFSSGTSYSYAFIVSSNAIADISGLFSLNTSGFNPPEGSTGYNWTISQGQLGVDNAIYLNYVVPEPSTYAMLILSGVAMAGYAIRRRHRRENR